LRVVCIVRKGMLARAGITTAVRTEDEEEPVETSPKADDGLRRLTLSELLERMDKERGERLKSVLTEVGRRGGEPAIAALGSAASTAEGEVRDLARELLDRQLNTVRLKT